MSAVYFLGWGSYFLGWQGADVAPPPVQGAVSRGGGGAITMRSNRYKPVVPLQPLPFIEEPQRPDDDDALLLHLLF